MWLALFGKCIPCTTVVRLRSTFNLHCTDSRPDPAFVLCPVCWYRPGSCVHMQGCQAQHHPEWPATLASSVRQASTTWRVRVQLTRARTHTSAHQLGEDHSKPLIAPGHEAARGATRVGCSRVSGITAERDGPPAMGRDTAGPRRHSRAASRTGQPDGRAVPLAHLCDAVVLTAASRGSRTQPH